LPSADDLAGRLVRRLSRVDPLARLRVARFAAHCDNSPKRLLVLGWPRIRRPHPNGRLIVGDRCAIGWRTHFDLHGPDAVIEIGAGTLINFSTSIHAAKRVTIGPGCAISWRVSIMDTDFHEIAGAGGRDAEVTIGEHVLICSHALVLKGVTIGDGAVVAAGAVVRDDVPPRALVAGVPARVVREGVEWRF
jgi:acetyltransferase-like isoleucine patch superfamily enzyme